MTQSFAVTILRKEVGEMQLSFPLRKRSIYIPAPEREAIAPTARRR